MVETCSYKEFDLTQANGSGKKGLGFATPPALALNQDLLGNKLTANLLEENGPSPPPKTISNVQSQQRKEFALQKQGVHSKAGTTSARRVQPAKKV